MTLYPLFADLSDREVLVVGAGEVAARKIAALLKAGATVRIHAHAVEHPDVATALDQGRATRLGGEFDPAWLDAVWLVVAATDDVAFNAALAAEAGRRRRLVNVVDDAVLSTFHVPAVVDRSPLVVAISSAGAAPMLARRVREQLETLLSPSLGVLASLFGRHRARIRELMPDMGVRRRWFERMLDGRLESGSAGAGAADVGLEPAFLSELEAVAGASPPVEGWLALLAASSEPDLYALRGLRALNEADVILLGPGVDDAALEPARRDAHRIRLQAGELLQCAREQVRAGARTVLLHAQGDREQAVVAESLALEGLSCRRIPGVLASG